MIRKTTVPSVGSAFGWLAGGVRPMAMILGAGFVAGCADAGGDVAVRLLLRGAPSSPVEVAADDTYVRLDRFDIVLGPLQMFEGAAHGADVRRTAPQGRAGGVAEPMPGIPPQWATRRPPVPHGGGEGEGAPPGLVGEQPGAVWVDLLSPEAVAAPDLHGSSGAHVEDTDALWVDRITPAGPVAAVVEGTIESEDGPLALYGVLSVTAPRSIHVHAEAFELLPGGTFTITADATGWMEELPAAALPADGAGRRRLDRDPDLAARAVEAIAAHLDLEGAFSAP